MNQADPAISHRRLLDALPQVVLAIDGSGRVIYCSSSITAWLGWTAEELQGKDLHETLAPAEDDSESQFQFIPQGRRVRMRRRDGGYCRAELETVSAPPALPNAESLWIVRPTKQVPAPPAGFPWQDPIASTLLDHLPVGVIAFDEHAVCRAANRAADRFLVGDRGKLVNRRAEDFPLPNRFLYHGLLRCIAAHITFVQTASPWELLGVRRYYDWRFEPLAMGLSRAQTGAFAVIHDVTERTHGELALQEAVRTAEQTSKRKTQFFSAVSHDLRTPVNSLCLQSQLMVELLGMPDHTTAEVAELGADMRKVVNNLRELLEDLLDLSRFDSGQNDERPTTFSLDEWLEASLAPLESAAHAKGLAFCHRVDKVGHIIRADRVNLTRVLANLAGNAVKFTESGAVDVSIRMADEGGMILQVEDTGPGIPADKIERVFDEFTQLRNPARDRSKGTGLGLAISRRLVEGVGGRLTVESRVGSGSCFTAQYPRSAVSLELPRPAEPSPPPAAPSAARSGNILIVEDDALTRSSLARLLQHAGYGARTTTSAEEALELIKRENQPPDLILLDLLLPGMEGGELLHVLRKFPGWSRLPVALLTGDSIQGRSADFAALNVDAILVKPIDINQFLSTIARLLSSRVGTT